MAAVTALPVIISCSEDTYSTRIIATNDTHGAVFPDGYTGDGVRHSSLASVCTAERNG